MPIHLIIVNILYISNPTIKKMMNYKTLISNPVKTHIFFKSLLYIFHMHVNILKFTYVHFTYAQCKERRNLLNIH